MSKLTGIVAALVLLPAPAYASGGACVIFDDFSDGTPAGTWIHRTSNPSIQNILERNGRVEFPSVSGNPGTESIALGVSSGWKVDMTTDWSVSARWHITPPTPSFGDVGMSFALMLEGNPDTLYMRDGFTLNAGVYNVGQGVAVYETTHIYDDGVYWRPTNYGRAYTENVVYIWYEAATGCINYNDHPGQSGATRICGISSVSSVTEAWIGFLAYNFGNVVPFSGSSLWCDDLCVRYGNVVGPSVGACCESGVCVQTIAPSCSGSWRGAGVTCFETDCGPSGACCLDGGGCILVTESDCGVVQGTWMGPGSECSEDACDLPCVADLSGNGVVDVADIVPLLQAWGQSGGPEDLNGDGIVDLADIIVLLAAWGPCP